MQKFIGRFILILLAITCISAIFVSASGGKLSDYRPYRIGELLREIADSENIGGFDNIAKVYKGYLEDIKKLNDTTKMYKDNIFNKNGNLIIKIVSFSAFISNIFITFLYIVLVLIIFIFALVVDILTNLVYILEIVSKVFTLKKIV